MNKKGLEDQASAHLFHLVCVVSDILKAHKNHITSSGFDNLQRKFRQADRDDSYFNDDDDSIEGMNGTALSTATVEDGGS